MMVATVITVGRDGQISYKRMTVNPPEGMDLRKVALGAYMHAYGNPNSNVVCDYERDGVYDILSKRTANSMDIWDIVGSVVLNYTPTQSPAPVSVPVADAPVQPPAPIKAGSKRGVEMARWTQAEQEVLRVLYVAGKTFEEIAEKIGRSPNSCYQHLLQNAGKWNLPPRPRAKKK
jgi:DNA-binding CsgD family transcriptional regulator